MTAWAKEVIRDPRWPEPFNFGPDEEMLLMPPEASYFYLPSGDSTDDLDLGQPYYRTERDLVIGTLEPLPIEVAGEFLLRPYQHAMGAFILDYFERVGHAVELTMLRRPGFAMLLHPSTKGRAKWQVTTFDDKGPWGDSVGDDPEKLVYTYWREGYCVVAVGAVDRLSRHWRTP